MTNFIVYKYSFPEPDQEDVLKDLHKNAMSLNTDLINKLNEASQSAEKKLNLQFEYTVGRNNELRVIRHSNTIYAHSNGVFLLQVHIEKDKMITPEDSTEKTPVKDYPWCWVIFDTRPDSQLILVQKKSEGFGKNTDYVADYLFGDYCERELDLRMNGTEFHLEKRICDGLLWSVIKHRTKGGHDSLKALCIKMADKGTNIPNQGNEVDKALQFVMQAMRMPEGEVKLFSSDETNQLLKGRKPDFIGIAEQLLRNNYSIRAEFAKSGSFECGKNTETIYGVEDCFVEKFCVTQRSEKDSTDPLALIYWINDIILRDNSYHYSDKLSNYGRYKRKERKSA